MSTQYQEYLNGPHWKITRSKKRHRARSCGVCGATEKLDVHHLNYRDLLDVEMSDLRVLCRDCHTLAHALHKRGVFRFTSTNHLHRWEVLKQSVRAHFREGHECPHWQGVVTQRWLLYYSTPKGGWTRAQLALLDVSWPPVKGWASKLYGAALSKENAREFESASNAAWNALR